MGSILSWVLFGFVAGLVARLVVPGRQRIGCLATTAVGIVGALIGGLIGEVVFGDEDTRFRWDLGPFLLAVAGSVVLLLALRALGARRR
ncbi:MAG: GlsB/YeaQ/YmgE family stress response membrane protein [Gaiellaceae bacterium]